MGVYLKNRPSQIVGKDFAPSRQGPAPSRGLSEPSRTPRAAKRRRRQEEVLDCKSNYRGRLNYYMMGDPKITVAAGPLCG